MLASLDTTSYLSELRIGVRLENYFIQHIFDRMSEARFSAVEKARQGKIRKFRHAFMKTPEEAILKGGEGIPFKSYNRRTLTESDYRSYRQLFETVSQEDAIRYYGVTAEEYTLWMAPWTEYFFYVARGPVFSADVMKMDFPDEETARQQTGEYPESEHAGNSDLWNQEFRSLYDSICDENPDLIYRIEFIEPPVPNLAKRKAFLD